MPLEGVFQNCVIVSIEKRYPMQARRIMTTLWGIGQMSFVKTIIAVDADVDVQNEADVLKLLLNETDLDQDLFFSEGILDVLNHASDQALYGSKLGIDATRKIDGEPSRQKLSGVSQLSDSEITKRIQEKFSEVKNSRVVNTSQQRPILLIALNKTGPGQSKEFIRNFLEDDALQSIGVLLILEAHVDLDNTSQVLWKLFNNLDPKRDIQIANQRIGIDLTRKLPEEGYQQDWPEEIVMSDDIIQKVDQKWRQLLNVKS
jgi:4-hydroxy-3-polyprenylbenzoate decarboxylase